MSLSLSFSASQRNMGETATAGAPKTIEELRELLKDDTKVKVAGETRFLASSGSFCPAKADQTQASMWTVCCVARSCHSPSS